MAKPRNSRSNHFQKLKLLVLLSCLLNKQLADAASLCYTYTVNKSESGQWSHKVQGQLNEKTFILCNLTNCHDIDNLGENLSTTKSSETQVDTLKHGIAWVIDLALLMKQENNTTRGLVKDTAGIFTSTSPTIAPDVDPSSSMAMKPNAFVLLFALALLVVLKYLQ